jgi:hypothetical protein
MFGTFGLISTIAFLFSATEKPKDLKNVSKKMELCCRLNNGKRLHKPPA